MTDRPLWRQTYDAVERSVAPRMEALVRSGEFAHASAWAAWGRSTVRDQINGASTRLWHLVNLPAGTDVQRLRAQVGALDREVRRLALALQLTQQADETVEEVIEDAAERDERPGHRAPRGRT